MVGKEETEDKIEGSPELTGEVIEGGDVTCLVGMLAVTRLFSKVVLLLFSSLVAPNSSLLVSRDAVLMSRRPGVRPTSWSLLSWKAGVLPMLTSTDLVSVMSRSSLLLELEVTRRPLSK